MAKNIVHINSVLNLSSTGRIVEELCRVSSEKGYSSTVFYGRRKFNSEVRSHRIGNFLNVYFHVLLSRLFDIHGLGSFFPTLKLVVHLKKMAPDIIHLHNIHGYYLNYPVLFWFLKRSKIPVVWTLFDCWAFTGHCSYYDRVGCDKFITHCGSCPQKKEYPASLMFDNSYLNFKLKSKLFRSLDDLTLLVNSKWLAKQVSLSFLKDQKVVHIPSGISTHLFVPSENEDRHKVIDVHKFCIIGVANDWSERKGLKDFLTLSKIVPANFRIIIVGYDEDKLGSLPDNMTSVGRTESIEELSSLYSSSDVFVNLTHEDNFPTTNLEALACGTPVITYDTGGSPEAIDSRTGYVCKKGDIVSIKERLLEVERKGKKFFSKACRSRAERLYSKEIVF